jgi:hypothetical protein
MLMEFGFNSLSNLAQIRKNVKGNEIREICNIEGAGMIKHIWMTIASGDPYYLRKAVIRMWWDNEEHPSVECPIGDFFGVGHAKTANFWSLPLSMGPEDGKGFNCFFPMPFSKKVEFNFKKNPTHEKDYFVMNAEGEGHFVGFHLDIHNLYETEKHNWPGEGDDYIEIDDGEIILYGTGTEDYFCTSWCPTQYYCSPYFGIPLPGGKNWSGKISYYRYHIEDPIYFHKNIKVKIEHGHANQRSDDWSSTAYWYQAEPHQKFKSFPVVDDRLPREEPKEIEP